MTGNDLHDKLPLYNVSLGDAELAQSTRKKYIHDVRRFLHFCPKNTVIKKHYVISYKQHLSQTLKVASINSNLVAINKFLKWAELSHLTVKTLKTQRRRFLDNSLSRNEYHKLLHTCLTAGQERNYLLLRTLAATGIRISELGFISVESAKTGAAEVRCKGKTRRILLPNELSQQLLKYCLRNGLSSGIIFCGNSTSRALHPSGVWKIVKELAKKAGVPTVKVYPHSFRHLFAKTYMAEIGNIFELAELLGHSSLETTRIYAFTSDTERRISLNRLQL